MGNNLEDIALQTRGDDGVKQPEWDGATSATATATTPLVIPWWAWLAMGLLFLLIFSVVLFANPIHNSYLIYCLDNDGDFPSDAARQLVINGDESTVSSLYQIAASDQAKRESRLKAIDVLTLMQQAAAGHALLRLELAGRTEPVIREHAKAARKQREAAQLRK
ncbi:MAG: hypothetical protein LBU79_04135 [Planctomycetota bacterium]|jgi:hypothetical protein|nr:hypothetical protein [Planctomycetota bacterium]